MNKKLAVMFTVAAFGLAHLAPAAAQTSQNAPAQTSPKKKSATPKKKATPKKSTAPKKKTTKTSKPKTTSLAQPNAAG